MGCSVYLLLAVFLKTAAAQQATSILSRDNPSQPAKINREYISNSPEHIRAILAFISTQGDTDCQRIESSVVNLDLKDPEIFDMELEDMFTPEKLTCKLTLEVGYDDQCSDDHERFVKKWFRRDQAIFRDIEACVRNPQAEAAKSVLMALEIMDSGTAIEARYALTSVGTNETKRFVDRFELELDTLRRTGHEVK